ncbi:MAG TPA: ABC transporter ATP-binding protein [Methanomicrobia archaeon]|nr:ABC transporter ATP-binding protein [Methanomicrobia archaeon]
MIVSARDLSRWYGEVVGLNKFSVSVNEGITGLVGPNGAGKTTFIRLLTGMIRPSAGSLLVLGEVPFDNPSLKARIGYCPEHEAMFENLSSIGFLSWQARMKGYSASEARSRAHSCLNTVGLPTLERPITTYSKGMKQRVKIAQALLHDPAFLILDEPFSGVDPVARVELFDLLSSLSRDGVHILLSSHVLHEVERLTSSVVLMNHGKLVYQGDIFHVHQSIEDLVTSIRLSTSSPRELASLLISEGIIDGAEVTDTALIVDTDAPGQLYERLPSIVVKDGIDITTVEPIGTDLETIFERMVR